MKKQQFLTSQELQIRLLSTQKKLMQLRNRYVIEVVTDKRIEQVRKTFRQFQYFNKIVHKKLGLKDKQLHLSMHLRSNNDYADLQFYINRLNSGYLSYRAKNDMEARRNANAQFYSKKVAADVLQLEPPKTRQLRGYLYDLLFREDELFIDGVDDEDSDEQKSPIKEAVQEHTNLKTEFKKQSLSDHPLQSKLKRGHSGTKNPFKKIWESTNADKILYNDVTNKAFETIERAGYHANDLKTAVIGFDGSKTRQKSNQSGTLKKYLKKLAFKAKNAGYKAAHFYDTIPENKNWKTILNNIKKCWIKFPNSYKMRDKNVIYKPYIWELYEIHFTENTIQFTNSTTLHKHRKIFVIFQCDVEMNFDEYTKIIVRNKIDKNPLQIRFSLQLQQTQQITQSYLALYTFIKESVRQQQQKLKAMFPNLKKYNVCNKVRIRINLKQKHYPSKLSHKDSGRDSASNRSSKPSTPYPVQARKSEMLINIPHQQANNDQKQQFQFKSLREASANVKTLLLKIEHNSIQLTASCNIDSYVDIDFPILDNFGALDIIVNEITNAQHSSFLPSMNSKDALCTFHLPVQTIYDYMYNHKMVSRKCPDIKTKMIQVKNTKVNLTVDYKCIGNYKAYCSYNQDDIYEDDEPPEQFNRDELRMQNNRLKRIIWSIQLYLDKIKDLKNFTYPNLSYLFYVFLAISCIFYDNNHLLFWVLVFLLSVLFYNSPVYENYIKDTVEIMKLQAKKKNLDTFLFKKNKLIEYQNVVPLKKQAKLQFLQEFILTRKTKRSIYKKYKRFFELALKTQILITKFVSFIQKFKNMFLWYHFKKTKLLFFFISGVVLGLMILPVRFILCAVVVKQMLKGSKYHANVQDMNRVVIIELLRIIIRENNLHYMSVFFKEHHRPLDWQNAETEVFIKTCNDLLGEWLEVRIDMENISKSSVNMQEFVGNLSKCKTKFQIKKQVCQKFGFSLQWCKTQNSIKKLFNLIYGFIVTIPSDKYIMGVKTVASSHDEEMDEVENIIDRELLNF